MKFSLRKKTILLIVCFAAVISCLAFAIYDKGIHDVIETQYEMRSIELARLVAVEIDTQRLWRVRQDILEIYDHTDNKVLSDQWGTPAFEEYVSQFSSVKDTEDYQVLLADLRRMQDVLDVDCLYLIWFDTVNRCYVYLIDAAEEGACPPGCIDPIFADDVDGLINTISQGSMPTISNTPEYGWLVSTAMPIHDSTGEIVAYSTVDISMNDIIAKQNQFLLYSIFAFCCMTVLVCIIGIAMVNRFIVTPINTLSRAAAQYKHNRRVFSQLRIPKGDEIGSLADSMAQMEKDIDGYITNLEQTTRDLISAREHAEQMDRAANIDALTKVRNKRAYDVEVVHLNESNKPYGLIMIDLNGLKKINDTYGHEKGDISINILCQIICRVFKHSPVYRVGGDEFVVILENNDYAERADLIESITDEFLGNLNDISKEPWERVTAAVGFAMYEPGMDECVDSVLQRADAAMYQNKKRMKAENCAII